MFVPSAFKKATEKENARLAETFKKDGKYVKSAIMKEAWERAKRLAKSLGGKAASFFRESLKKCWSIAKSAPAA